MSSLFPEMYKKFLPQEIYKINVHETKATCHDCLMVRPIRKDKRKNKISYQANLKCCTFEPLIPNYVVGALLKQKDETIKLKIKNRLYALPIGVVPSVRYQVSFNNRNENEFGNREDWLCSYYDKNENQCSIWRYRGSVCTGFFCESSFGKKGLEFWGQLTDYYFYVEMALLEEALVQMDFSPRQMTELLEYVNCKTGKAQELKSDTLPLKKAQKLWNGYFDEQEEFYIKCYQIIANLDKKTFAEATGEMGLQKEEALLKSLRRLNL